MFTGIVEEVGEILSVEQNGESMVLSIKCGFTKELSIGESVAVSGICLTVTKKDGEAFFADVTPETYRRTSFASINAGSKVNLERAMKANGRFSGHIVSGHIDGVARLTAIRREENSMVVTFCADDMLLRYVVEKGSVALDGISLTVSSVKTEGETGEFSVSVIPHTWDNTALCGKREGSIVNLECDIVGKYIDHFLSLGENPYFEKDSEDEEDEKIGDTDLTLQDLMTYVSFH